MSLIVGAFQANTFQTEEVGGDLAFQLVQEGRAFDDEVKKRDFILEAKMDDREFIDISKMFLTIKGKDEKWLLKIL